jgi:D-tyrosyl-tRNA(Tyr) deacylase
MKIVVQRVTRASVSVDKQIIGQIGRGFMVLVGIRSDDTKRTVERIVSKMTALRIFADENGKTNLSLKDVGGELLIVSQFTLYADTSHGNRPGFTGAGSPKLAEELYEYFIEKCRESVSIVEHGSFGADMAVELINDGPFTIILE